MTDAADREVGMVEEHAAEEEAPVPTAAPETGMEPDPEAAAQRAETWGGEAAAKPGSDA